MRDNIVPEIIKKKLKKEDAVVHLLKRSFSLNVSFFSVHFKRHHFLRENVPEDRVKSRKCGTCLEN